MHFGVTLPKTDGEKIEKIGGIEVSPDEETPFADYLAAGREVFDQLGISLYVGVPENLASSKDVGAKVPTQKELETYNAKIQVLNLARTFAGVPINLTANMGIKGMAFTAHGSWAGLALTDKGLLNIDVVNASDNYKVGPHELYHLVDVDECDGGSIYNDPGYVALNRNATYAGTWPLPAGFIEKQPKSFEAIADKAYELYDDQRDAQKHNDAARYCKDEAAVNKLTAPIEMMSDYSHRDVGEGKAETGKEIFDQYSYADMLDPNVPVRREQFLYLLARMYRSHPEVVQYYALEATRPYPASYACDEEDYRLKLNSTVPNTLRTAADSPS